MSLFSITDSKEASGTLSPQVASMLTICDPQITLEEDPMASCPLDSSVLPDDSTVLPDDTDRWGDTAETEEDRAGTLKISILMCAYNEQKTIARAIRDVLSVEYPCEIELIVVDDGSKDDTAKLVQRIKDPRIILHKHSQNRGKGAALRTAASLATGTHILPFDADLEYSPKDIPRLIEPILTGRFDVVYGVRLFGYNTVYQSFRYAVGNKVLTTMTNILFDSALNDLHTCLKLMPLDMFTSLRLRENGFGLDTEVTAALLRLGVRPFEVPVSYYSRSHAQGKKISWRDAVACLRILCNVRTTRKRRLFLTGPKRKPDTRTEAALAAEKDGQSIGMPRLAALDTGVRAGEE